jgi:cyclic pyranopterin phosphate synthase
MMGEITHMDDAGNARMVDVGEKKITRRVAIAEGFIALTPKAFSAVVNRQAKKGDVLTVAQIAGIGGAKRTADLIPLCHPMPISSVDVQLEPVVEGHRIRVVAKVVTDWRTGVEMEAMTAVSTALLTVYDVLKSIDKSMVIGPIQLLEKRGGKSGHFVRDASVPE